MEEKYNNETMVLLKNLDRKCYAKVYQYILQNKLTKIVTDKGIAVLHEELVKYKNFKITLKEEDDCDYSHLVILRDLDPNNYSRVYYYIKEKRLTAIDTPKGIGVDKNELQKVLENPHKGGAKELKGYKIDLSTPSRMNCLYKRLASMNKYNKSICQRDNKLTRYVDENNYVCINLKDYLKPQIKAIAKKLECKEHEITACMFDLLHSLYLKQKGELENDQE